MPLKLCRRKGTRHWYLRGTVAGQPIFESTGTSDRGKAEALRIRREGQTWEWAKLGIKAPATFAAAAIAYMEHGGERRFLPALIRHFGDRPLTEITQAEVDRAAALLQHGSKTSTRVRQVYSPIVAVLSHAADAGLEGARHRQIKMPKVKREPARWARDEEIEAIVAKSNPDLRAIILIMTYTGLRISEVLRIEPRDLLARPGWLNIGRTKNGTAAMVPLPQAAREAVMAVVGTDRVFSYETAQGVNKALVTACKAAGTPQYSTHEIGRHAFAARLLNAGYDLKTVKEAGRWKKLAIVDESYGHLEISRVHDAMLDVARKKAVG